jgi:hypothetical protein
MQPREENFAFVGIVDAIANLGFAEDRPIVRDLLAKGLVADDIMEMRHFDEKIKKVLADPERRAGFISDSVEPYTDVIAEMATWHSFTEAGEQEELEAQRHAQQQTARKFGEILADPDVVPYPCLSIRSDCTGPQLRPLLLPQKSVATILVRAVQVKSTKNAVCRKRHRG